jgi:hypothetical protein
LLKALGHDIPIDPRTILKTTNTLIKSKIFHHFSLNRKGILSKLRKGMIDKNFLLSKLILVGHLFLKRILSTCDRFSVGLPIRMTDSPLFSVFLPERGNLRFLYTFCLFWMNNSNYNMKALNSMKISTRSR